MRSSSSSRADSNFPARMSGTSIQRTSECSSSQCGRIRLRGKSRRDPHGDPGEGADLDTEAETGDPS